MTTSTRKIGSCTLEIVATSNGQMLLGLFGRSQIGHPTGRMEQHSDSTLAMGGEHATGPIVSTVHIRMASVCCDKRRHKTGVHFPNKWHTSADTATRVQTSGCDWNRTPNKPH